MAYKLRLSLLTMAAAFMVLLLLPYGAMAASNHPHSITRTLGSHGIHKSARAATLCGTVTSPTICEFAYIYDTTSEMVSVESDVNFDSNGPLSAGITHTLGSPTITVATAGTYLVTYSVSSLQASQFALFVNGSVVPETIHEVGNSFSQNTGSSLITLPAGATITLRNHTSFGPVELLPGEGGKQTGAGGTLPSVNASIIIQQI
ncbi:BclA C-terminal domain-containing protein [Dictyobacter kobayashii]|uniref:BclA C-terminal domain-containing protein n=1 Tax=Dictyobacter kobayashii TaxID=2014872 RepID=UPI001C3FE046|nr:hypothetical protein [Dictyobacter kobayashii]